MVRLNLKNLDGDWVAKHADFWDCDKLSAYTSKSCPGKYWTLWTFHLGDSSVALGVGRMSGSCKIDMHSGFLEFNPNKVWGDGRFWKILNRVASATGAAKLKRFDLALDVGLARDCCHLVKDRRNYRCDISSSVTQYLGARNTPGFVKVYDKAKEAGLIEGTKLTRVEMTCSGDWSADDIVRHWPKVFGWNVPDGTKDWVKVVGIMMAERHDEGKDCEELLNMLGKRSRPKVRAFLDAPLIELSQETATQIWFDAHFWEGHLEMQ